MENIEAWLTNYVIQKGVVKKEEREVYQYGFEATLEMTLCIVISAIIAGALGMIVEGILFFVIFIPLRSYAGGLHLEHYWACLFLSCLTFSGILLICKYLSVGLLFSFVCVLLLGFSIWCMYPVENVNRLVDREEDAYFKKRLKKYLLIDFFIVVGCFVADQEKYLLLCMVTFFMIAITMLIGKYKNEKKKMMSK